MSVGYTVTDNNGATDTGTLTITVMGANDAPIANDDGNSATEDGALITGNVGSNDTDVDDGATRTYALDSPAPAGLTFDPNGSYSFDPSDAAYQHIAQGATQIVIVTYSATDDQGATDTATLTITVTGTNDAPVANDANDIAIEDDADKIGSVATSDTDVDDGATRTFALNAPVAGLFMSSDGTYSFDPSNAAYQHIAQGATETVVATYTATDQFGATGTATLTITVNGVNDAPVANDDTNIAIEDGVVVLGDVGSNDSDVDDGATRIYSLNAPVAGLTLNGDGSYSFDPSNAAYQHIAAGATQVVVATYTVTDQFGATDTATLTVTVTGVNDAPVANDDGISATEDGSVVVGNVGSNDTDVDDGATRTYALNGPAPAGLTFNPDGSYGFDPSNAAYQHIAAGATQIVSASYTVTDDNGATDTATLTITVTGVTDAPVANDDVNSATEDGAVVTGNVGTNDSDVDDGSTRTFALNGPAPAGLSFNPDGSYSFDPSNAAYQHLAAGATQIVVATYTMTDDQGATDTASLTISVTGVNDAPVANDDSNAVTEDGAVATGSVASNDTDVDDGATRTYALNAAAPAGLTFNPDGSYSFDPSNAAYQHLAAGATQVVAVTYTATDDQGATDTATLTITVTGANDAPDAVNDADSATEDGAPVTGSVAGNDSDADDSATRAYALSAPVAGLILNPDGSYSFDPSNAAYQHIAEGATQVVVASYTVTDGQGASDTATLTITVTGVNDAPDAVNDANSATEDGSLVTGNVGTNDTDVDDGATRSFALNGPAPAGLSFNPDGSYSFDPSNAAYQHLAAGATQLVAATYTITDEHGATDIATLTITVTGVNDAPDAANDANSATEDGAVATGSVATNDSDVDDGTTRTYALNAAAPAGLTFNPDGSYSFDPSNAAYQHLAAGATQVVAVSYTVTDDQGATDTATLTITVTGANDAPDGVNDANSATEDGAPVAGSVATNDSDVDDGATRTYALNAPVAGLTLNSDGSYGFDPSNAAYQHIAQGASQVVVATYTATDEFGATDTATLTITVTGINDAPDAVNDANSATEDGAAVTGNVGANDTDADDGATRTFALVGSAPAGLTFNPDGSYSFDPTNAAYQHLAAGATQIVAITYTITDDKGAADSATLTITVTGVDDPAVARNDAFVIDESAILTGSLFGDNGSGADSDPDGPLAIAEVNGNAANVGVQIALASGALLTVNANGGFTYNTNHAFDKTPTAGSGASNQPAADSFTYRLAGGGTATVSLTINGLDTNDLLIGTSVADAMNGGAGNDVINGLGGNDTLDGGAGNDVIDGGSGNDLMRGGSGDDSYFVELDRRQRHRDPGRGLRHRLCRHQPRLVRRCLGRGAGDGERGGCHGDQPDRQRTQQFRDRQCRRE